MLKHTCKEQEAERQIKNNNSKEDTIMKCTVCGNENHEGTNYCIHCGTKLEAAPAQEMNYYQGYAQQAYPQVQYAVAGAGVGAVQMAYPQQAAPQMVAQGLVVRTGGATSGLAVASLIFGILTVLTSFLLIGLGLINSLLAVAFGISGIVSCKKNHKAGMGMAIAGLIMGAFGLILVAVKISKGVALFKFVSGLAK